MTPQKLRVGQDAVELWGQDDALRDRDPFLEFLEPIQDDVDVVGVGSFRPFLQGRHDDNEFLTVGCDVVVPVGASNNEVSYRKYLLASEPNRRLR